MPLTLIDVLPVTSPDSLTSLQLEQLYVAGQLYDGVNRSAEQRFVELQPNDDGDPDEGCLGLSGFLVMAKVMNDADDHLYDLWCVDPDSATLFVAGTLDVVAGRCQSTWMTPDLMQPFEEHDALDAAMKTAGLW